MDVCEQETIAQLFDKQKSILAAKRNGLLASHPCTNQYLFLYLMSLTSKRSHLNILFDSHPGKKTCPLDSDTKDLML